MPDPIAILREKLAAFVDGRQKFNATGKIDSAMAAVTLDRAGKFLDECEIHLPAILALAAEAEELRKLRFELQQCPQCLNLRLTEAI